MPIYKLLRKTHARKFFIPFYMRKNSFEACLKTPFLACPLPDYGRKSMEVLLDVAGIIL